MCDINLNREIIFGSSDTEVSRTISALEAQGKVRKLAPKIYTTNLIDEPVNIIRRNLIDILAKRYPGAVISHRSANEMRPTPTGEFFMTSTRKARVTDLPGIVINIVKGPKGQSTDISFNGLFISSQYRWMLECMQVSRKSGDNSKALPIEKIESRLERILLNGGEEKLNEYRDKLREIANDLGFQKEFDRLNKIISALLNTHSSDVLVTESAKAIAVGEPFDANRVELFEILFDYIKDHYFLPYPARTSDEESFRLFSFFESYFSNYIEGTEFSIDEAKQIVDSGIPIPRRDEDSHDILGTFRVLSNRSEMMKTPDSETEFFSLLQSRHEILLSGRPSMEPGSFKQRNNRAGMTEFVDHQLVKGTLKKGFQFYKFLQDPMARAIFMMFMVSEVHPFNDGNGRVSRIMMNAELVKAQQTRIIVPTVFREDYILALRKLTRQKQPATFVDVMEKLQRFSDNLYGTDFTELKEYLAQCNAYSDPTEAKLRIIDRLQQ